MIEVQAFTKKKLPSFQRSIAKRQRLQIVVIPFSKNQVTLTQIPADLFPRTSLSFRQVVAPPSSHPHICNSARIEIIHWKSDTETMIQSISFQRIEEQYVGGAVAVGTESGEKPCNRSRTTILWRKLLHQHSGTGIG